MFLIFDYDGTLVDSEWAISERTAEIATRAGYSIDAERVFREFSGIHADMKYRSIAKSLGLSLSDALAEELALEHARAKSALYTLAGPDHVFANVPETLATLGGQGHRAAICSNGEILSLSSAIRKTGLGAHFQTAVLYTPDSLSVAAKPEPDMLIRAAELNRCGLDETIMLGDTPADMGGARAAGIPHRFAFVNKRHNAAYRDRMKEAGATAFFSDHNQLPAMIAHCVP
jgi:phosphoglycolate phosphatase